jgi:hypothetical protein
VLEPTEHPRYLTRNAERSLAASAITTTTDIEPVIAHVLTDMLDLVSQSVLAASGLQDPAACKAVLGILWGR